MARFEISTLSLCSTIDLHTIRVTDYVTGTYDALAEDFRVNPHIGVAISAHQENAGPQCRAAMSRDRLPSPHIAVYA